MATFLPSIPAVVAPAIFVKGLQNNGTTTSVAQYVTFGHCFQKGQMTSAGMQATINSVVYPVQVDVKTKYADGSVCHAILTLQWPTVAAGALVWGQFAPSAAPSGSILVLSTVIGATTLSLSLTASSPPDWTANATYSKTTLIRPTVGNAGGYVFQWPSDENNYTVTGGATEPTWPQTLGSSVTDGSSNPTLTWYNIGLPFAGTITQDLVAAVKDSTDLWLSGPLAVQGRANVLASNPGSLANTTVNASLPPYMRLVVDFTVYADGTVFADVLTGNDVMQAAATSGSMLTAGTQEYTAEFTLNGTNHSMPATILHSFAENWTWQIGTLPHVMSSSQDVTLQVVHNPADFIEAQAITPYDTTIGVGANQVNTPYVTVAQNNTAVSTFGQPFAPGANAITNNAMESVGDSYVTSGIGPNNSWAIYWLTTQNQYFWACNLEAGRINGVIPWHIWNPNTGHYWLGQDNIYLMTNYENDRAAAANYWEIPPIGTADWFWTLDYEHYPDLVYIPYLATGRRYFVDELYAVTAWVNMADQAGWFGAASSNFRFLYGQYLYIGTESTTREQGWGMRHCLYSTYALPDTEVDLKQFFRQVLDNNFFWICGQLQSRQAAQGECYGWLQGIYGDGGAQDAEQGPWENDYGIIIWALAASMGHTLAAQLFEWQMNFRIGMLLSGTDSPITGYPPADAVIYDTYIWQSFTQNGGGVYTNLPPAQSWEGLEQLQRIYGSGNTANCVFQGTLDSSGTALTVSGIQYGALATGMQVYPSTDDNTKGSGNNGTAKIISGSGTSWTLGPGASGPYSGQMSASMLGTPGDYVYWNSGTGGGGGNLDDFDLHLYNTLIRAQTFGTPNATQALNTLLGLQDVLGIPTPNELSTNSADWQNSVTVRTANRTLNDSQVFPGAGAPSAMMAQSFAAVGALSSQVSPASVGGGEDEDYDEGYGDGEQQVSGIRYAATFSGTSFAGVSVSAAQDLFSIIASSTVPVRLHRLSLSTSGQTSPGNLIISVQRFTPTVTAGSGGSALTPVELSQVSGRAATSTVRANDTTRATTTGTKQVLWAGTLQDLNNLDEVLVPELWPAIPPGNALVVGLEVAPGSAVTLFGAAQFSELT